MTNAVTTTNLVKKYGSNLALNGLTISIPSYAITGLVGANGAGKTTWMMAVAGFLKTNSGTINLLNQGPFKPEIHSGRISILPQDSDLPAESYPLETLVHYGRLQGLTKKEAVASAKSILTDVNLSDRMNSTIRSLSHGMRKRVMIAQCFVGNPELILLDEPLSGLDPKEVANMRQFISKRGKTQTIVISSHNTYDLELMCDYVAFIKKGKSARLTTIDEMTGKSGILSYRITDPLESLDELEALLPESLFTKNLEFNTIVCRFNSVKSSPELVNKIVIPYLQERTGVVSVERGLSFEEKVLNEL